jgi:hypothetical protein
LSIHDGVAAKCNVALAVAVGPWVVAMPVTGRPTLLIPVVASHVGYVESVTHDVVVAAFACEGNLAIGIAPSVSLNSK